MKRFIVICCLLVGMCIPVTAHGSAAMDYLNNSKKGAISYNQLSIPVLTYHLVSEESRQWSTYCISPQKLEEDFKLLQQNGLKAISLSELSMLYTTLGNPKVAKDPGQTSKLIDQYKNAVVLTCDDGYSSDFLYIFPLMKKYNIKFNFFIVGDFINKEYFLTSEQIIQMAADPLVEFGNHSNQLHTFTNPELKIMYGKPDNKNRIVNDYLSANDILTPLLQKRPPFLSYPYGVYSDFVDYELKNQGFQLRFNTSIGVACPFNRNTNIGRINRANSISSAALIKMIKSYK